MIYGDAVATDINDWHRVNKSSPRSFGKSVSLAPCRRMHSPTVCASCSQYNA